MSSPETTETLERAAEVAKSMEPDTTSQQAVVNVLEQIKQQIKDDKANLKMEIASIAEQQQQVAAIQTHRQTQPSINVQQYQVVLYFILLTVL